MLNRLLLEKTSVSSLTAAEHALIDVLKQLLSVYEETVDELQKQSLSTTIKPIYTAQAVLTSLRIQRTLQEAGRISDAERFEVV